MAHLIAAYGLYEALKAEGYELPKECCDVRLLAPVDGLYRLELIVNLTNEDVARVGRALVRVSKGAHDTQIEDFR